MMIISVACWSATVTVLITAWITWWLIFLHSRWKILSHSGRSLTQILKDPGGASVKPDTSSKGEDLRQALKINMGSARVQPAEDVCVMASDYSCELEERKFRNTINDRFNVFHDRWSRITITITGFISRLKKRAESIFGQAPQLVDAAF